MFRGEYKNKTASGTPITYLIGDIVLYDGKVYECSSQTQKSPLQTPNNWKYVGLSETVVSNTAPIKPKENQLWVDSTNTLYVWSSTDNIYSWKQISGGTGGGGGAGITGPYVTFFNGLTGAINFVAGTNISITPSGNTFTISASGGGGVDEAFVIAMATVL
jgi:hypothetical protein